MSTDFIVYEDVRRALDDICDKINAELSVVDEQNLIKNIENDEVITTNESNSNDENVEDKCNQIDEEKSDELENQVEETDKNDQECDNLDENSKNGSDLQLAENSVEEAENGICNVPRRGRFYEHDDRRDDEDVKNSSVKNIKNEQKRKMKNNKPSIDDDKWQHDLFDSQFRRTSNNSRNSYKNNVQPAARKNINNERSNYSNDDKSKKKFNDDYPNKNFQNRRKFNEIHNKKDPVNICNQGVTARSGLHNKIKNNYNNKYDHVTTTEISKLTTTTSKQNLKVNENHLENDENKQTNNNHPPNNPPKKSYFLYRRKQQQNDNTTKADLNQNKVNDSFERRIPPNDSNINQQKNEHFNKQYSPQKLQQQQRHFHDQRKHSDNSKLIPSSKSELNQLNNIAFDDENPIINLTKSLSFCNSKYNKHEINQSNNSNEEKVHQNKPNEQKSFSNLQSLQSEGRAITGAAQTNALNQNYNQTITFAQQLLLQQQQQQDKQLIQQQRFYQNLYQQQLQHSQSSQPSQQQQQHFIALPPGIDITHILNQQQQAYMPVDYQQNYPLALQSQLYYNKN